MARIVSYDIVLKTLLGQGLKSLYYNSGAFGFPPGNAVRVRGWIGEADSTLRAEALAHTRQVPPPFNESLVRLTTEVWENLAPGELWVMPRSHWAYELDFGSSDWMPALLREVGVDPAELAPLTTGAAIAFDLGASKEFASFLARLLDNVFGSSDFQLAWPGRELLCTVHHHKQLWWSTPDEAIFREIDRRAG